MPVNAITGSSSLYYSPEVMGKEDFLRLLTVQLKHQDPTKPLENSELLAQLAQFSSLEQLLNINGNLQANFLMTQSMNNSLAASFIGKVIKASGNEVYLKEQGSATMNYELDGYAEVTLKVYDEDGELVRTLTEDWQEAGERSVVWDGKDESGNRLPTGKYTFKVDALDAEGNTVGVKSFIKGKVSGVRFSNGGAVLVVDGLEVSFGDILEILEASDNSDNNDNSYPR